VAFLLVEAPTPTYLLPFHTFVYTRLP
jgi:hypothetical protein